MGVAVPWTYFTDDTHDRGPVATVLGKPSSNGPGSCTVDQHVSIIEEVRDKIIAIDASLWMFHAHHKERMQGYIGPGGSDEFALERSVIDLFLSKVRRVDALSKHVVRFKFI